MENFKGTEMTKELEMALDFMEKHGREAKIATYIKRADMYEIFDEICDAEKEVIGIRQELYDEGIDGEHINVIYERPETNVLFCIFKSLLLRDLDDSGYGLCGMSITVDIPTLAMEFIDIFLPELENLDKFTKCAFELQANDLLEYATDKAEKSYMTFCKLEHITGLDKEEDFDELNKLAKRIDDYTLEEIGENPLKNYRGKDRMTDAFIDLLDIMASLN